MSPKDVSDVSSEWTSAVIDKTVNPAMNLHLSVFMIALLPMMSGCQSEGASSTSQTQEHSALVKTSKWMLSKMILAGKERDLSLDKETLRLIPDSEVTLSFTPKLLHGDTGCNSFSGTYLEEPDGTFQWQGGSVTEMPCPGKLELQQTDYLKLLSLANNWQVEGNVLTLSDGTAANQLQFVPHRPPSLPLEGTHWRLTDFTQSDSQTESATSVLAEHHINLKFETGKASGNSGCNTFQVELTILAGQHFDFRTQTLTVTEESCQDQVMQQEEKFLQLLPQMTRYTIREQTLSLSNEQGTLGLQFARIQPTTE